MYGEEFFCGGEEKRRRKRKKIYGEGKDFFFVGEKKSGEGKGEIIWTRKINGDANQPGEPAFSKKTEGRDLQYSQQRRGTAKTKVKQKYDSLSDVPES